jgi:hypothetical protein
MPLTEELVDDHFKLIVCEISADFDHPDGPRVEDYDLRRWALHAIWVVGMNCGLRFDKLVKLEMNGISMGRCSCMTLAVKMKNSDKLKTFQFSAWPNVVVEESHAMDPNLAPISWLKHRVIGPGLVFCDFHQG